MSAMTTFRCFGVHRSFSRTSRAIRQAPTIRVCIAIFGAELLHRFSHTFRSSLKALCLVVRWPSHQRSSSGTEQQRLTYDLLIGKSFCHSPCAILGLDTRMTCRYEVQSTIQRSSFHSSNRPASSTSLHTENGLFGCGSCSL